MSTKPIVVIYLPENFLFGDDRKNAPMKLMEALNGNFGEKPPNNHVQYSDYWKDYYWFSFYDYEIEAPRFEVFYEKNFTPIQFEELKTLINNAIEAQKIKP
jgi:hypothetical protein